MGFVFVTCLADFSILDFLDPVVLNSCFLIFSPRVVPKDAVQLAPTKALKTGARSTPHTVPRPLPAVDLEAAAARLREAMARGTQAAQQARAQEEGDAGQSGAEAAAQAADTEEAGQSLKLRSVWATRPAPPDRIRKEKLAGTRKSALPTM